MKQSHDSKAGNADDIPFSLSYNKHSKKYIYDKKTTTQKYMYNTELKTQSETLGQNIKGDVLSDCET